MFARDNKGWKRPVSLSKGAERTYLEDGDAVRLTGWAGNPGTPECVGFGQCYGQLRAQSYANGI